MTMKIERQIFLDPVWPKRVACAILTKQHYKAKSKFAQQVIERLYHYTSINISAQLVHAAGI